MKSELPSGLSLYDIEPNKINVNAVATKIISLPVKVQTKGKLEAKLKLISISTVPDNVHLIAPKEGNNLPKLITTEPVDLSKITESAILKAELIIPKKLKLSPDEDKEVEVNIKVKKTNK